MPALLQVQNLAKAYGAQQLFTGLRFGIEPGERISPMYRRFAALRSGFLACVAEWMATLA